MRVVVIRGDIPGPIFLADLEDVSQYNPPTEPVGQERYLSRPTSTTFGQVMGVYAPATLASGANIVFPLAIAPGNDVLKIRSSALAAYTSVTIPAAVYADVTTLLAAINSVLPAGFVAVPLATSPTNRIALQTVAAGAGTYIQIDSVAGGSTFNTPAGLAVGGASKTVPSAATVILATIPVGGPVDVSPATIRTQVGAGLTAAQVSGLQDGLAPYFIETDVAIKSFQVGYLSDLRNAAFNPDPNRIPAIVSGPAIAVVADDGVTPYMAPVPTLTNAQFNVPVPGAVTLTGVGLAGPGAPNSEVVATRIKLTDATLADPRYLDQAIITNAGGTVSATSIVIPAALVPAGIKVGSKAQVRFTSLASNQFTLV